MNHGYHIQSIEADADLIAQDSIAIARNGYNCNNDKVTSYWGGNTPLNLDFSS